MSRWLERFLYRQADHILVNSPAYRDHLLGEDVPSSKVSVVANGADLEMFDPAATGEYIRQRHSIDDAFLVVYAGAHGMANDLGTILQAASMLRDHRAIHFLFAGTGRERAALEERARALDLHNVTFAGALPRAQMPQVLAAADVCIATLKNIPMFNMTYPNKVFDYMAAGRPTVLAIDGVIRQVMEAAEGGIFVPPGNVGAMADAIMKLYQDPALRRRMGLSARQYVSSHFDRQYQAADFHRLLQHLLCESSPTQASRRKMLDRN
jgi:glycosyltransferase involved in cell wall biosynthesis